MNPLNFLREVRHRLEVWLLASPTMQAFSDRFDAWLTYPRVERTYKVLQTYLTLAYVVGFLLLLASTAFGYDGRILSIKSGSSFSTLEGKTFTWFNNTFTFEDGSWKMPETCYWEPLGESNDFQVFFCGRMPIFERIYNWGTRFGGTYSYIAIEDMKRTTDLGLLKYSTVLGVLSGLYIFVFVFCPLFLKFTFDAVRKSLSLRTNQDVRRSTYKGLALDSWYIFKIGALLSLLIVSVTLVLRLVH